ncbi:MAG: site-specific integrase [bacterium]|nr:site-specific integrase [bacterium]
MLTANDLEKLLPEFIEHLSSLNSSRSTLKNYASDIRKVFSKVASFDYLEAEDLNQALKELSEEVSESSLRRFYFSLKSFLSWAESKGYPLKKTAPPTKQPSAVSVQTVSKAINHGPVAAYLEDLERQGSSKATLYHYQKDVSSFLLWKTGAKDSASIDDQTVKRINRNDINRYSSFLHSQNLAESSIKRYLGSLKSFLGFHKETSYKNQPASGQGQAGWFKRLIVWRPGFWHAYRGHPISDYVNWAGLAGVVLLVGLNFYSKYLLPAPININELTGAVLAASAPPQILSFQGRLTNSSDAPVTGATDIIFYIYDARTAGTLKWTSRTWTLTPDSNGIFSACLGDQDTTDDCLAGGGADTAFPADLFTDNPALYLEVEVEGETLSPRQRISSVSYSLNSGALDGVDSTSFLRSDTSDNFTSGTLTIDDGTTLAVNSSTIGLGNASGDAITVNGTATFNTATNFTLAGTENVAMTSDLAGTVDVISIVATPSSSAGTTQGIFVQQAASANTNGLDVGIAIDNADTDLLLTDAISITNTGAFGDGYSNFLNTPTIDITAAGAITGATGITSSGTITFSSYGTDANGVLYTHPTGGVVTRVAETETGSQCLLSGAGASGVPTWGSCSAGGTTWDAIGDAAGNGAIAFGSTVQTLDWATMDANASFFSFNFTNAGTSAGTDSGVVINNAQNDSLSTDNVTENLLLLQQLDTSTGSSIVVSNALKIDSAANAGITDGIEITNSGGNITNGINLVDTAGGTFTTGISLSGTMTTGISLGATTTTAISIGTTTTAISVTSAGIGLSIAVPTGTTLSTGVKLGSGASEGNITTGFSYSILGGSIEVGDHSVVGTDAFYASSQCITAVCGASTSTLTNGLHIVSDYPASTISNGVLIETTNSGVITDGIDLSSCSCTNGINLGTNKILSSGSFTIDLNNAAADTLTITNGGAGVPSVNIDEDGSFKVGDSGGQLTLTVSDLGGLGQHGNISASAHLYIGVDNGNASADNVTGWVFYRNGSLTAHTLEFQENGEFKFTPTQTSGNILDVGAVTAVSQSAALTGLDIDLSTNYTVPNSSSGNQIGLNLTLKDGGASATANGITVAGTFDTGISFTGTLSSGGADITSASNRAITVTPAGTGDLVISTDSDTEVQLSGATSVLKLTATDNTAVLNLQDTSSNTLFQFKDLNTNFGGLAIGGAFASVNSYYAEEFNRLRTAGAGCIAETVNARGGDGNTNNCTASTGPISVAVTLGATAACAFRSVADSNGGYEEINAADGTGNAACLEYIGTNTANDAQLMFNSNNLPVALFKVRPTRAASGDTNSRYFIGLGNLGTAGSGVSTDAQDIMDTSDDSGIYFSNCTDPTTASTCNDTTWNVSLQNGATISTKDCGVTISTTNFAVMRIEVVSAGASAASVNAYVDGDVSDGVSWTACPAFGSVTVDGLAWGWFANTHANASLNSNFNFHIDYVRVWQDDAPSYPVPEQEVQDVPDSVAARSHQVVGQASDLVADKLTEDQLDQVLNNAAGIWYQSSGKAVSWISNSGEAVFLSVTSWVGEFRKLIFGELVVKDDSQVAGEISFDPGANEVFIESEKITDSSLIYITPTTKTDGLTFYIKEKRSGEGFVVGLQRNRGDLPGEASASATQNLRFNWLIVNKE